MKKKEILRAGLALLAVSMISTIRPISTHAQLADSTADCRDPKIEVRDQTLYIDNRKIEADEVPADGQWKSSCDSGPLTVVAYISGTGNFYEVAQNNATELGYGIQRYEVAKFSGDVIWLDGTGTLHKNSRALGRVNGNLSASDAFSVDDFGRVTWTDGWGKTHTE